MICIFKFREYLNCSVSLHCLVECFDVVGTCLDDGDACVVVGSAVC